MASCEAKTHNVLYGANVTNLFALYIVTNKTQLCVFAASLHCVSCKKFKVRSCNGASTSDLNGRCSMLPAALVGFMMLC